ncbi:MAG: flagellar hook-length control protein FliK [Thermodesulfobacteriota bacterium]
MQTPAVTSSPQLSLADLFLNSFDLNASQAMLSQRALKSDRTFNLLLGQSLQNDALALKSEPPKLRPRSEPPRIASRTAGAGSTSSKSESSATQVRRSAKEEMERQVQDLGVPLDQLSLGQEDLDRLEQVLEDSGYTSEEVQTVMAKLSQGPLTMDRVLAVLNTAKNQAKEKLKLSEESLPLLGQFLQELGVNAEKVNEILSELQPGQTFGSEEFKKILLNVAGLNLRTQDLSQVNQDNLKSLLTSLGIQPEEQQKFWNIMNKTGGKVSLEGLAAFLKSAERPEPLTGQQIDNIRQFLDNLVLNGSLRPTPYFNRILNLLQALGDQELDEDSLSESPAIQALRQGTGSVKATTMGTGNLGQSGSEAGQNETGFNQGEVKAGNLAGSDRAAATTRTSRLYEEVAKQVADKIVYQFKSGQHNLRLNLIPEELGRLNINLLVKENSVQATIIAETSLAKGVLEEQMASLREALAQQGLELKRFDVSLGWQNQQENRFGQERNPSGAGPDSRLEQASSEIESDEENILAWRRGRVDRMI